MQKTCDWGTHRSDSVCNRRRHTQAIIALLSDSQMRERMGRSGRDKTVANYTWDKVTDKVEKLYLELLAAK